MRWLLLFIVALSLCSCDRKPTALAATSTATTQPSGSTNNELLVYVTKTGKKYHSSGCRFLAKSKIEMKLGNAKAKGFTACSKCYPPE